MPAKLPAALVLHVRCCARIFGLVLDARFLEVFPLVKQKTAEGGLATQEMVSVWAYLARVIAGVQRAQDKALRKSFNVPFSWMEVLIRLSSAPGMTLRMTELARVLILHKSRVTHLVTELENRGLVSRQRTGDDLRGYNIVLTEKGRQMREDGRLVISRTLQEHLGQYLSPEDVRSWGQILSHVPDAHLWTVPTAAAQPSAAPERRAAVKKAGTRTKAAAAR